jgi:hypothetical protein
MLHEADTEADGIDLGSLAPETVSDNPLNLMGRIKGGGDEAGPQIKFGGGGTAPHNFQGEAFRAKLFVSRALRSNRFRVVA